MAVLLDLDREARRSPGASVEPPEEARGRCARGSGPRPSEHEGAAPAPDVDEDERAVSFRARGHEARGKGTAAATITNRLREADGGVRLVVETDVNVSGRSAQLGREIVQDVGARLPGEVAERLERELRL